jgi:3'(2'), 5'-bisphosphate nucleotidase
MSIPYATEKEHAYQAVVGASTLCRHIETEMVKPTSAQKTDRSPVTVADYVSQAVICRGLAEFFPNDPVVAEEAAGALRGPDQAQMLSQVTHYVGTLLPDATADDVCDWIDHGGAHPGSRFWTLDPIDGTKGFLRREQYAVALALIVDGQIQVGAMACPNLALDQAQPDSQRGVVFLAVRGHGAEMRPLSASLPLEWARADSGPGQPIAVTSVDDPSAACFVESVESGHTDHTAHESIAKVLGITQPSLRLDSQAKYGAVARGDAAIYLRLPSPHSPDYRECIWDHAAGALIVEEAAGRVTDALGADLDFSQGRKLEKNQGIVASNGHIHTAILNALHRS